MTTRRLILACIVAAILSIAITATAHASPAPDDAESDCSWAENGITIKIGDVEYRCLCALLTGPSGQRVLCRWYAAAKLPQPKKPKPKPKPAPKKPPKKLAPIVRVYPKPSVVA